MGESSHGNLFGVLGEFHSADDLRRACRKVHEAGYTVWDAHSPFPVHGLDQAMGLKPSPIPWFVLILGLSGAAAGMLLQWWTSAVAYPLVISGKPLFSWPAFIPITFECGVLGGALGAFLGFLGMAGLPRPYHPLFRSRRFERATDDRFFISIEARDPRFHLTGTARFLDQIGATHVEKIDD
ncbi:MAG: DUF3341 domain-containing protein [Acidobacteriota bacterium]